MLGLNIMNNISKRQDSLTSSMNNNKSSIDKNKNFNEAFYFLKTLKLTDAIDYIEKNILTKKDLKNNRDHKKTKEYSFFQLQKYHKVAFMTQI